MRRELGVLLAAVAMSTCVGFAFGQANQSATAGPVAETSSAASVAKKALKRAKRAERAARLARRDAKKALANQKRTGDFLRVSSQGGLSRWSEPATVPAGQSANVRRDCEPGLGEVIVAGAFSVPTRSAFVYTSHPIGNGWSIGVDNTAGTTDARAEVEAICAKVGKAVTPPLTP